MSRSDPKMRSDQPLDLVRLRLADVMLLSMGYAHVQQLAGPVRPSENAETDGANDASGRDKPAAAALRASVKYPVWRALVSYWGDYLTTIDIDGDGSANALTA